MDTRSALVLRISLTLLCILAPASAQPADDLLKQSRTVLAQIEGEKQLHGLRDEVRVVRDKWGIAHIEAGNAYDLFFAQGFVVAQDRLFQIELWRRTGIIACRARRRMASAAEVASIITAGCHEPWDSQQIR